MADSGPPLLVAGVDGCKEGWICVVFPLDRPAEARSLRVEHFRDLLELDPAPAVIAVDMPIGLPDRLTPKGRGPEQAVRPLLGARQSSVFTVPSRGAVFCDDYRAACDVALATSEPPRKVSKQCFHLFPKIRELDALMTPQREAQIYEAHPEVAFWRLNGDAPMSLPKKVKGAANGPGLDQRAALLVSHGYSQAFLDAARPKGVGRDDLLDAAVNGLVAQRIVKGEALPFPDPFERDGKGLRMAIWA
ncbi:DUF429 domain-containing protein [Roseibium aestuarii]|uniref:DUF429 domain-containing protein n=1 Tax=Roseibium aestuarii TaxID=2600299 RepID=A0ABW4JWD3_9HYPH|nr:DUF429 domain-containing protein [Roseibium aestuarii]